MKMKLKYAGIAALGIALAALAFQKGDKQMTNHKLTPEEEYVIVNKGTEAPFSCENLNTKEQRTYTNNRYATKKKRIRKISQ
jgi:hypothetical protein